MRRIFQLLEFGFIGWLAVILISTATGQKNFAAKDLAVPLIGTVALSFVNRISANAAISGQINQETELIKQLKSHLLNQLNSDSSQNAIVPLVNRLDNIESNLSQKATLSQLNDLLQRLRIFADGHTQFLDEQISNFKQQLDDLERQFSNENRSFSKKIQSFEKSNKSLKEITQTLEEFKAQFNLLATAKTVTEIQTHLTEQLNALELRLDNFPAFPKPVDLTKTKNAIAAIESQLVSLSQIPEQIAIIQINFESLLEQSLLELKEIFISNRLEQKLLINRKESYEVLQEALDSSPQKLIMTCPWINQEFLNDYNIYEKLDKILKSNHKSQISIVFGYYSDLEQLRKKGIDLTIDHLLKEAKTGVLQRKKNESAEWLYSGAKLLTNLIAKFPTRFKMYLCDTHAKFLICDDKFAMIGSHNFLLSKPSQISDIGIRTTDQNLLKKLNQDFENMTRNVTPVEFTSSPNLPVSLPVDDFLNNIPF